MSTKNLVCSNFGQTRICILFRKLQIFSPQNLLKLILIQYRTKSQIVNKKSVLRWLRPAEPPGSWGVAASPPNRGSAPWSQAFFDYIPLAQSGYRVSLVSVSESGSPKFRREIQFCSDFVKTRTKEYELIWVNYAYIIVCIIQAKEYELISP